MTQIFTDAECAAYLPLVKQAYLDVATGGRKTSVKYNNRTVTYGPADKQELKELLNILNAQCGCTQGKSPRRGPATVRRFMGRSCG